MPIIAYSPKTLFVFIAVLTFAAVSARADLFSLRSSGTISVNTSGDPTIPVGTPFSFELTYDTAAPDLDFELLGSPDPTYGKFKNTATPPALIFFHFQAGNYEATLNDPADFGDFSEMAITFTTVNAIDINISAPTFFPHLAGGPVGFHADFNAFSTAPIFSSDAPPTNTALSLASFDQSTVTLLPPAGVVTTSSLTSFTITAVQQPSVAGDFNNNGTVDAADYVVWRQNKGMTNMLLNDNGIGGVVGQLQYDLWRARFGASAAAGHGEELAPTSPYGVSVPEPGAIALVLTTACFPAIRIGRFTVR